MDLVYIVAKTEGTELRYSIRSMVKHLTFDRIFIIGHKPDFLQNVIHIPKDDVYKHDRARNIYEKLLTACYSDVSEDFISVSDDYFLLTDFNHIPYYYCGSLEGHLKTLSINNYYKGHVQNTYQALLKRDFPTLNFNIHAPIIYNKNKFIEVMTSFDWDIDKGYISKSLYCNSLRLEGEVMEDYKVRNSKRKPYEIVKDWPMFSTNEYSFNFEMRELLKQLYPVASRYEKV